MEKRRRGKPGACSLAPEIADELFEWVVYTHNNTKGRISPDLLKGQAMSIKADYERYWRIEVEKGHADPTLMPKLPQWDSEDAFNSWILWFRQQYFLSWNMVNLRMKCSMFQLKLRVKLFFTNLYRVRWLHYYMHGERQILRFVSWDVPMYISAVHLGLPL